MKKKEKQWCSLCQEYEIASEAEYYCPKCGALYCDECADEMICRVCAPVLEEIK